MPALIQRRAAQGAGDQDAAGHHVEREQQHDEAHVFGEHRVHERGERGRRAERDGDRREREQRPDGGDLAVVGVPDFREQQRPGGDRSAGCRRTAAPTASPWRRRRAPARHARGAAQSERQCRKITMRRRHAFIPNGEPERKLRERRAALTRPRLAQAWQTHPCLRWLEPAPTGERKG